MAKETKKPGAARTAPAPAQPIGPDIDWSAMGVTGVENVGTQDLGIPFLAIIQKGSPQFDKSDKNYAAKKIEGCNIGDIFNNISNTVVYRHGEDPMVFIPCYYQRLLMEWKPRNAGGGVVMAHNDPSILNQTKRNDKKQDVLPNGNIIADTAYFFGKLQTEEGYAACVIGMTSTQLKKARAWLNLALGIKVPGANGARYTPPLFSHKYGISTVPENNDQGSWMGWRIELIGPVETKELAIDLAEYSKQIHAGKQRMALPAPSSEPDESDGKF
jgi:hypothetical protein